MKRTDFQKVLKTFAIFLVTIIVLILGYAYRLLNNVIQTLPDVNLNNIYVAESTKVYDTNGEIVVELGVEKRDLITFNEINQNMINALIAIEDERFFIHNGIDYHRMFGALYQNLRSYSYSQGASTLTQQLVKLSYLSNEKTLERKIKEIFISIELENKISKEEIIEAYLNRVLFGGRIYGVEKASKYYFNKPAKDLNYEEAALLAGMVQSPNRFNPYENAEATKLRQITVLNAMYTNNFITKEELVIAINRPMNELIVPHEKKEEYDYYEYIDEVIYELESRYNINPLIESIKVYTHLDRGIQDYVHNLENDSTIHPNEMTQTGIVVMETQTGIIRAIGGGRGKKESMGFNFATNAQRQPGSTIKPLLDYGPAIEYYYYSPAQPYLDEKIYYSTSGSRFVQVENYDNKYKGYLTMREAIIDSRNVTAVKAFRDVGSEKAYEFAQKLGLITTEPITEAHAIGGYREGFTVLQMTAAYAPFGNGGYYIEPTTVDYIVKNNEKIKIVPNITQAMRSDTAYLMTDILHDNMNSGTAMRANVPGLILAGKTGQTNYEEETKKRYKFPVNCVRDSWFIGYSPKYTTAVWLGYDKITENAFLTSAEARISLDMFRNIMEKIHPYKDNVGTFPKPDNIIEVEIETNTMPIKLPNEHTPYMYRKKELFIEGTEPKELSNRFKPLDAPKNFISYYDEINGTINFNWERYERDFSLADFELMEKVHYVERFYDNWKNKVHREYIKTKNISSVKNDQYLVEKKKEYCTSQASSLCGDVITFNGNIALLEALKNYEISHLLKDKNLPILSEGELSEYRGYRVWNGYRNGIYSNLGSIEYKIIGTIQDDEVILYRGPYQDLVTINLSLDEFLEYDSFSIEADYEKYRGRLKSNRSISLNPFFSIE